MSLSNSGDGKKVRVGICDQLIDGRYLNAVDSDFLESVLHDVQNFHDKYIQSSILVFPPFNNYRRFLIHKLVEDNFENLSTFSIGHSSGRRTVVCYQEQLRRKESVSEPACVPINNSMGVLKQSNSNEDQDPKVAINCSERKKVRALPDVAIYRPPALRKADEGPSPSNVNERKPRASKQRRPDIAVYVPRALRGVQKSGVSPKSSSTTSGLILKQLSDSSCESGRNVEDDVPLSHSGETNVSKKISDVCSKTVSQSSEAAPDSGSGIQECPQPLPSFDSSLDGQIDTSRINFSPSSPTSSAETSSPAESATKDEEFIDIDASSPVSTKKSEELEEPVADAEFDSLTGKSEEKVCDEDTTGSGAKMECAHSENVTKDFATEFLVNEQNSAEIDDGLVKGKPLGIPVHGDDSEMVLSDSSPCDSLQTSEESRSNILGEADATLNTEVAIQSERKHEAVTLKGVVDSQVTSCELGCAGMNNLDDLGKASGVCENDSEDDSLPLSSWEDLFDLPAEEIEVSKAGDSKTHKLMEEVVTAVGKVSVVEKPRCNYSQYRTDNVNFMSELSHVVEIYGFPSEFKTQDLISVLSAFGGGNSGAPAFEIKWVDDTHALAVFASSFVATDVLNLNHPLVKTRSLDEASAASKTKARKTCESLRIPFRPRPETCAALAQRLITGALGVNRRQSKAEREEERRLLREAREKRRNAAKERDAAWEGTIASTL